MKRPRSEVPTEIVSISEIQVEDKPRKWTKHDITLLAREIEAANGLFYPVIIARIPGRSSIPYYMKDGWGRKRLEAVTSLLWTKITAVVLPHFDSPSADKINEKFVKLIEAKLRNEISDYEIAKSADYFEKTYQISASDFARVIGISMGYCYNLIRRYTNIPEEVRTAWRDKNKLISQFELEKMSHMSEPEALIYWKKRVDISTTLTPFNPHDKKKAIPRSIERNGKSRRASESKLIKLADAVSNAPLKETVRELVMNVIRFSLGSANNVPGITDYTKLSPEIIDKRAEKKSA